MKNLIAILLIGGVLAIAFASGTGGISGIVTDSATGNPIVGACVCAMGLHHQSGANATTNENGEYIIENLTPGDYRVNANARGYYPKHYPDIVAVVEGQITPNINFALVPAVPVQPGSISGIVTSETGEPIGGAIITVTTMRRPHGRMVRGIGRAITNSDGSYTVENLNPGEYRVMAHAVGYEPAAYPELVLVESGQNTPDVNFVLNPRTRPERNQEQNQENNGVRKPLKK